MQSPAPTRRRHRRPAAGVVDVEGDRRDMASARSRGSDQDKGARIKAARDGSSEKNMAAAGVPAESMDVTGSPGPLSGIRYRIVTSGVLTCLPELSPKPVPPAHRKVRPLARIGNADA